MEVKPLPFLFYKCEECTYRTKSFDIYNDHLKNHRKLKTFFNCADDVEGYQCAEDCGFETDLKSILVDQHIRRAHQQGEIGDIEYTLISYICRLCPHETCSLLVYGGHSCQPTPITEVINQIEAEMALESSECSEQDQQEGRLEKHTKRFECYHCQKKFTLKCNLKQHILTKHVAPHQIKLFKCDQYSYKNKYKSHITTEIEHSEQVQQETPLEESMKRFDCIHCQQTFTTSNLKQLILHIFTKHMAPDQIKDHILDQIPDEQIPDEQIPDEQIPDEQIPDQQIQDEQIPEEQIPDEQIPDEQIPDEQIPDQQIQDEQIPDQIERFKCDRCSFKCKYKSHFTKHLKSSHGNLFWFKCHKCSFQSKFRYCLRTHLKVKHGIIEWLWCDHCSYKCKVKVKLTTHLRQQHGNVAGFKCDQCSYISKCKEDVFTHLKSVHGNLERLNCDHCSYKSKYRFDLKCHEIEKHGNLFWFKCDQCSFISKDKNIVITHLKKFHPK